MERVIQMGGLHYKYNTRDIVEMRRYSDAAAKTSLLKAELPAVNQLHEDLKNAERENVQMKGNRVMKRLHLGMSGTMPGDVFDYDIEDLGAMRRIQAELRHRGYNLEDDPAARELQRDIARAEQQWYSCNPFVNMTINRTYGDFSALTTPPLPPPHLSNKLLLTIRRTK